MHHRLSAFIHDRSATLTSFVKGMLPSSLDEFLHWVEPSMSVSSIGRVARYYEHCE
jgi:hypothetical protein